MAQFTGYVRRVDFERKKDFLDFRVYAHVFFAQSAPGEEGLDVYTDDPTFIGAFLSAYARSASTPSAVEVHYDDDENVRTVVRVVLDVDFS
ncbi:MAG TPA: hypothetical protein VGB92_05305 [Longimicrobium sp.]|jgi:hypothetical protein